MAVTILTGDNQMSIRARRAELLSASGASPDAVARYNLVDPEDLAAFQTALTTLPLFGGARYLEASPAALLPAEVAAVLRRVSATDTVVLHGEKAVPAAVLKAAKAEVEVHKSPTGTGVRQVAASLARSHDLALTDAQLTRVADRCAGDVGRLQSVMYSLAVTAQTTPSDELLDRYLTGAQPAAGTPWALTDQLGLGHIGAAMALADTVEPLAVLAFIATRLGQMGRILEDGLVAPEQAASAIGLASLPAARNLLTLANRVGHEGLAASWDVVTRADIAAKSSTNPRASLELALCELHQIWTHTRVPVL